MIRDLLILLAVTGAVFTGLYLWISMDGDGTGSQGPEQETLFSGELEDRLAEAFEERFEFIENEHTVEFERVLNKRFIPHMEQPGNFKGIRIIDRKSVNAFTTVGDRIYLFRGLVQEVDDPLLVAAVVAHELGHVHHNHVEDRLKVQLGTSLLASILTGGNEGMMLELTRTISELQYSRSQEEEADEYARKLLERSGIHPQRLAQVFLRIKSLSDGPDIPEFLASHPSLEARIEQTLKYEPAETFSEEPVAMDWRALAGSLEMP